MTEALLVGLSIRLVWGVQMRRAQKATVIGAFGTRLLYVWCRLLSSGSNANPLELWCWSFCVKAIWTELTLRTACGAYRPWWWRPRGSCMAA